MTATTLSNTTMQLPAFEVTKDIIDSLDVDDLDNLMLCLEEDEDDLFGVEEDPQYCQKKRRWQHVRLDWNFHVAQLLHEDRFFKEYKMSVDSWNLLRNLLRPHIERNPRMSRTIQPITVDIIMGIGMRYLTGSHKNTVRHVFGVSMTECQRSALTFIDGLTKCKALDMCMPRTAGEWDLI